MRLEEFVGNRNPSWVELDRLARAAGSRPQRLGPDGVRQLATLYRQAAADLSYARRHYPGDPAVGRLAELVLRVRPLVYDSRGRGRGFVEFFAAGYWRLVRERPGPLAVAALALLGSATLAWIWALVDAQAATGLIPGEFRDAIEPGPAGTDQGMTLAEQAAFSTLLFTNNIQVMFLAFATGITAGVGTVIVLVMNGITLGAVGGILTVSGNGGFFLELVAAHGVLEVSCIIVAGAAGIRMGWALIEPGTVRRTTALATEARSAVLMVLGTMPWLVAAGLIEAFISGRGISATPLAVMGAAIGVLYWWLVWKLGRPGSDEAPQAQSRALDLARR